MSKPPAEIRKYELELIPVFWNALLLITIFLTLLLLSVLISNYFLIPFGLYFLLVVFSNKYAFIVKRKRTIELHSNYLKIIENKQQIDFTKVLWFRVDDIGTTPMISLVLQEKGKMFPKKFATLVSSPLYQNWVGFKKTTLRRIQQSNPQSLPWSETHQGKFLKGVFLLAIITFLGIALYESPFLFLGVLLFLVLLIVWEFRR